MTQQQHLLGVGQKYAANADDYFAGDSPGNCAAQGGRGYPPDTRQQGYGVCDQTHECVHHYWPNRPAVHWDGTE